MENGEEEIFPDPMSAGIADGWRASAVKALQRQFAAYAEQSPVKSRRRLTIGSAREPRRLAALGADPSNSNLNGRTRDENAGYTTSFTVDQSPEDVFKAINNVRAWWLGDIEGRTDRLGDEFTYRYQDLHRSTHKITELAPGKKIVWHTVDASLNFVKDKTEWNGTDIVFEIARKGDKTELRFTQSDWFRPSSAMAAAQAPGAPTSTSSLRRLIMDGKAKPNKAA